MLQNTRATNTSYENHISCEKFYGICFGFLSKHPCYNFTVSCLFQILIQTYCPDMRKTVVGSPH
jgi:hypothetical protein